MKLGLLSLYNAIALILFTAIACFIFTAESAEKQSIISSRSFFIQRKDAKAQGNEGIGKQSILLSPEWPEQTSSAEGGEQRNAVHDGSLRIFYRRGRREAEFSAVKNEILFIDGSAIGAGAFVLQLFMAASTEVKSPCVLEIAIEGEEDVGDAEGGSKENGEQGNHQV